MLNKPQLSLGSANFNNKYGVFKKTYVNYENQEAILATGWKKGFRKIDTAESYKHVHKTLGSLDIFNSKDWGITSKLSKFSDYPSKDKIRSKVNNFLENTLNDLRKNKLESVLVHDPDIESQPKILEIIFQELNLALENKIIESFGVSLYKQPSNRLIIDNMLENKDFVVQGPINIFDRRLEDFFKSKNNRKCIFEGRSVFLQGLLLNADIFLKNFGERKECNNFFSWLEKKNISPIEACISFARYSTADKIIVGFANSTELELFSDIFERVKEFSPPRFCDDEEILNPMNWKD